MPLRYLRKSKRMSAKYDYNGHKLEILSVEGKPGFYNIRIDGCYVKSENDLSISAMTKRVRQEKAMKA